jgi:hypothetical protein
MNMDTKQAIDILKLNIALEKGLDDTDDNTEYLDAMNLAISALQDAELAKRATTTDVQSVIEFMRDWQENLKRMGLDESTEVGLAILALEQMKPKPTSAEMHKLIELFDFSNLTDDDWHDGDCVSVHMSIDEASLIHAALQAYQPKPTKGFIDADPDGSIAAQMESDRIAALSQTPQTDGWISVKDRLPTKDDGDNMREVLAWDSGQDLAIREHWSQVAKHERLTHWMPLPTPPNAGKDE